MQRSEEMVRDGANYRLSAFRRLCRSTRVHHSPPDQAECPAWVSRLAD